MKPSLNFRRSFPALRLRGSRIKQVGVVSVVFLLALLATGVFLLLRALSEGKEIREYVGGPFSSQLLYLQGCATGTAGDGRLANSAATLDEQFDECRQAAGGRPGYYVYDFNIRRSVALSRVDMEQLRNYEIFAFPDSVTGRVENSPTNPFNRIIAFEAFMGFEYDCSFSQSQQETSCNFAPAKCDVSREAISCSVFDPRTGSFESHVIKRDRALELLLPQGYINGPDLYKMLKPRFFPVLER
ncbi:MAG: hypothetical protein F4X14_17855 [Caldilineaceae bacterium SB0661_bin_32]|uniref:Uncharacterized protein n=1 Tax=Caldilineaceae bacterium SB0661_bin_32 TaxID=2605255 RepID=A0A6B1DC31_9CHLR|nr:hypothetical protein [Caldilineaceae bacterium SB0661_bin_32]